MRPVIAFVAPGPVVTTAQPRPFEDLALAAAAKDALQPAVKGKPFGYLPTSENSGSRSGSLGGSFRSPS